MLQSGARILKKTREIDDLPHPRPGGARPTRARASPAGKRLRRLPRETAVSLDSPPRSHGLRSDDEPVQGAPGRAEDRIQGGASNRCQRPDIDGRNPEVRL